MSLEEKLTVLSLDELRAKVADSRIGVFLAFMTKEDPHSPLMYSRYYGLVDHSNYVVPLTLIDADEVTEDFRNTFLVQSVPTIVWVRLHGDKLITQMRLVGTVLDAKLCREFDVNLEKVLSD